MWPPARPWARRTLIVDGGADFATTFGVSGNYFTLLQIRPHAGRLLQEADDNPQAPPVAVISYGLWQRRFAADPQITTRTVSLNNTPVTIVGVLPRDYTGIQRAVDVAPDITYPLSLDPRLGVGRLRLSQPTSYWLQIAGRLKPGSRPNRPGSILTACFSERPARVSIVPGRAQRGRPQTR